MFGNEYKCPLSESDVRYLLKYIENLPIEEQIEPKSFQLKQILKAYIFNKEVGVQLFPWSIAYNDWWKGSKTLKDKNAYKWNPCVITDIIDDRVYYFSCDKNELGINISQYCLNVDKFLEMSKKNLDKNEFLMLFKNKDERARFFELIEFVCDSGEYEIRFYDNYDIPYMVTKLLSSIG